MVETVGRFTCSTKARSGLFGPGGKHAAARAENRPLAGGERLGGLADLEGMPLGAGLIADDIHRAAVIELPDHLLLHIDGDVDEHRAGTPGRGNVERLFEYPGKVGGLFDDVAMLCERFGGAGDVGLLKHVPAQQIAADLAGDDHQGDGVHVGGGNTGEQIGGAGAGGGHTDADPARNPGISGRCMGRILLGAHQHMVEGTAGEGVVKRANRRAGISKQCVDSLQLQALDHSRSSRHHGERPPFRKNASLDIADIIHPRRRGSQDIFRC